MLASAIAVGTGCGSGSGSHAIGGSGGTTGGGGSAGTTAGTGTGGTIAVSGTGGVPVGGGTGGVYHLRPPDTHRAQGATCNVDRGTGGAAGAPVLCGGAGGIGGTPCTGLNAACCHYERQGFPPGSGCTYDQCATDSDCGAMAICTCGGGSDACSRNGCEYAECRTDADCGAGLYCSRSPFCGSGDGTYKCHTPDDECADDADCPWDGGYPPPHCRYDSGHWRCTILLIADCP